MTLVYLCFCVHEVLHDNTLRVASGAIGFLVLEMTGLIAVSALLTLDLHEFGSPMAAIQGTLGVLGTCVLLFLFKRHRARLAPGAWRYGVFVICFSWLVVYSLGQEEPPVRVGMIFGM